jgi:serine/threonine-protein kinase
VACATARDPGDRYADAIEMAADLDAIAEDLRLPAFRVPAPRNSAQHRSAAVQHSRISEPPPPAARPPVQQPPAAAPVYHPTRQLTRGPQRRPDDLVSEPADEYEYQPAAGQFAGISVVQFALARQQARRMVLVWVAIVLAVTGMVATAAWTIGSNLTGLL